MDRPEWLAIDPTGGWVYCTLTNNSARGASGQPGADAANPRADNTMGQIIRWQEEGDFDGERFHWNHLVLAGDPANERAEARGNIKGDAFACPDTMAFDARGVLWIGTDIGTRAEPGRDGTPGQQPAAGLRPGQRRGAALPDRPGGLRDHRLQLHARRHARCSSTSSTRASRRATAATRPTPRRYSNWPDFQPDGRPRSATVAVRRNDGGVIGDLRPSTRP